MISIKLYMEGRPRMQWNRGLGCEVKAGFARYDLEYFEDLKRVGMGCYTMPS